MSGVSFVVPVHNGAQHLDEVLGAIVAEAGGTTCEVLVVDDRSTDASASIAARWGERASVRILSGPGRGAAAAINVGVREARQSVVCQVDQDVVVQPGGLGVLLAALAEDGVGAAQGVYVAGRGATVWARVAALDLELRWARLGRGGTDHVCSGNTAYRAAALAAVGGLDETLGYGYDNDLSYRLTGAGHRLVVCPSAKAVHLFREGLASYLEQQYGQGYGRLDVIARHPRRVTGDRVSGLRMILHVPAMLAALLAGAGAAVLAAAGRPWWVAAGLAAVLLGVLAFDRAVAACEAWRRSHDGAAFLLVPAHLLRDVAWVGAALVWGWRRLTRRPGRPWHSMGGPAS